MSADTNAAESPEIPDEYADVDPVLIPLFEEPSEWFQEPVSCYETAFGPFGDIHNLTPEAVTFRAGVYDEVEEYRQSLLDKWRSNRVVDGRITVDDEQEAERKSTDPTVWLTEFGRQINIYERVPFDNRVTTPDGLKAEIDKLIDDGNPYWDETFDAAQDVAVDLGLISPAGSLSDDEYHTAYKVLQIGRDESDLLTDNEKAY